jgi:DNA-binding ferritin-like protein
MPTDLTMVIAKSEISNHSVIGDAMKLLETVYENTEIMLEVLDDLYKQAEKAGEIGLSNYAQDRIIVHKKFCWMLRSIVGGDEAEEDKE